MIDILVYLFENYLPEACPEPVALARKLTAAGFEEDEISEALNWLEDLDQSETVLVCLRPQGASGIRFYDEEEQSRLSLECRGFITLLEQAGSLDPELRELVIERALALTDGEISLSKLKVIVLAVMWRRQREFDVLILEELLSEDEGDERLCH
ncbi:MAG TPA: DUF494 domain-containing protein [Rhodocyclaceae bacterium]